MLGYHREKRRIESIIVLLQRQFLREFIFAESLIAVYEEERQRPMSDLGRSRGTKHTKQAEVEAFFLGGVGVGSPSHDAHTGGNKGTEMDRMTHFRYCVVRMRCFRARKPSRIKT